MRDDVVRCFAAGIAAADPAQATRKALARADVKPRFTRLVAVGKAALPMAHAADTLLRTGSSAWDRAVVVPPAGAPIIPAWLPVVPGEHPLPGPASVTAADAVGRAVEGLSAADTVLLLLSGGATSLMAAPVPGVSPHSLGRIFADVLASGLDIHEANIIRKRFLRWGGGRLAAVLGNAACLTLAISDVIGDQPASIGSGPVTADPATAADVARLSAHSGIRLPDDARHLLDDVTAHPERETPKPDDSCFRNVQHHIIASNRDAVAGAAHAAAGAGWAITSSPEPLQGDAAATGGEIARRLLTMRDGRRHALILGGETTVTIRSGAGLGGRSHELALAAAHELEGMDRVLLLAAGTDGRDGTTGSAGAIVDGASWQVMSGAADALARHDSGSVLGRAGLALHTGLTGTNVMDVVIGLCW